ncbi:hypothetical protein ZWY2020_036154 [Hordeum vulgare]|nr:hypothetical protein ZWY2020_036154 [Hordeum vulgare]
MARIASALEYLHFAVKPHVVHCDVTSSNIFVEADMCARLDDFVLLRLLATPDSYSTVTGWEGCNKSSQIISIILRITETIALQNSMPFFDDYGEDTPAEYASEGSTVYVGNLPYHIDDESLALSFDHAGVVAFSEVIYDDKTGQSRRFGYVTMSALEEAEKAVRTYHGYVIYGSVRPLTVYITAPRQSGCPFEIFVCNLPWQVDNSWLEKLFSTHDKVVDARVVYYECRGGTRRSRGFGFVTMATEEQSYYAINSLNKQILEGRTLRVKVSREKLQQGY